MRRETTAERAAWTAHFDGTAAPPANKYGAKKTEFNGRTYDSIREAKRASELQMLEQLGVIKNLQYQVRHVLVEGNGKIRPIVYVSDFEYVDAATGQRIVEDAKGFTKVPVYRLKRKLLLLLKGIEIREV